MASISEDIQNIALDNIDPDPVLNDLSSGKVVSRQGIATTSQHPKQSVQNVNSAQVQQSSSSHSVPEVSTKSSYPSPWMPSTSGANGTSILSTSNVIRRFVDARVFI